MNILARPRVGMALGTALALVFCALGPTTSAAPDTRPVRLKAATFDAVVDGEPDLSARVPDAVAPRSGEPVGRRSFLVQFDGRIGKRTHRMLTDQGVEVVGYVPERALLVRLPPGMSAAQLGGLPDVRWAGAYRPAYRVAPDLLDAATGAEALSVDVLLFPGESPEVIATALGARDGVDIEYVKRSEPPRITARLRPEAVRGVLGALARDRTVQFVSRRRPLELHNDQAVWIGQSYDRTNGPGEALAADPKPYTLAATLWNHGLRGEGQIIAVADTGLESDLCFFSDPGNPVTIQNVIPPAPLALDPMHRKILAYNAPLAGAPLFDDSFRHGTHVTGSAAGDDLSNLAGGGSAGHDTGDGMAPKARVVFQDISGSQNSACNTSIVVLSVQDLLEQEYLAGARISNNSWGSSAQGFDLTATETDGGTWQHEDFAVFVSAGNNGAGGLGGLAACKNCIAVGATENYDATFVDEFGILDPENLVNFSSLGPTADGRIKPDITAPGSVVVSARFPVTYVDDEADLQCTAAVDEVCFPGFGGCYLTDTTNSCHAGTLLGTSMASPLAAGLGALARQYFIDGFWPTGAAVPADTRVPSAALIKATMINGARNMTGNRFGRGGGGALDLGPLSDAPANSQGWGRVMLDDALYFSGDTRRLRLLDVPNANGLETGERIDVTIAVTSAAEPLKLTLVWSDPPGLPTASGALVNDLDLELSVPGGAVYRGNQFTPDDPDVDGDKVSAANTPGKDSVNNVEGLLIPSPAPGIYTATILGTDVPGAPGRLSQGFALVTTGAVDACTAAAAPTGFSVTPQPGPQIELSWNAVPGALGYKFYRNGTTCSDPMAADTVVELGPGQTTFTDTTVTTDTAYNYTVRAIVSADGCETADSVCTSATTLPPGPPPVPDGTNGPGMWASRVNLAGSTIDVRWSNACGATSHHILYGQLADAATHALQGSRCAVGTTSYLWLGAPSGDLWFVVVSDDGGSTEGSWGRQGDLSERGAGVSGECGMALRDDTEVCP